MTGALQILLLMNMQLGHAMLHGLQGMLSLCPSTPSDNWERERHCPCV